MSDATNTMNGYVSVMGLTEKDITGTYTLAGVPVFHDLNGTVTVARSLLGLVKFAKTTATNFAALVTKDKNTLYFLEDTREIYKGEDCYTNFIVPVATLPATGKAGRMYLDYTLGEGYIWNGSWVCISRRVSSVVLNDGNKVSGEAVKTFVDDTFGALDLSLVDDILYNATTKTLAFVKGTTTNYLQLTKIASAMTYNTETGKVGLTDAAGNEISSVNIPLDNYVVSGTYDEVAKGIVLTLKNGSSVIIPASDLVKIYHAGETGTAKINITTIDGNNTITADVKTSTNANNLITIKTDGLHLDKEAILKIADPATSGGNVITVDGANGHAKDGGTKLTDIATKEYADAIKTTVAGDNVPKVDIVTYNNLDTAASRDSKVITEDVIATMVWGSM